MATVSEVHTIGEGINAAARTQDTGSSDDRFMVVGMVGLGLTVAAAAYVARSKQVTQKTLRKHTQNESTASNSVYQREFAVAALEDSDDDDDEADEERK